MNSAGIDATTLWSAWRLEFRDPAARGLRQTAYRVLVASSQEAPDWDEGDLWDSTKVLADQAARIVYAGKRLFRMECY